jgi:hypothetical protein
VDRGGVAAYREPAAVGEEIGLLLVSYLFAGSDGPYQRPLFHLHGASVGTKHLEIAEIPYPFRLWQPGPACISLQHPPRPFVDEDKLPRRSLGDDGRCGHLPQRFLKADTLDLLPVKHSSGPVYCYW